MFYEEVPGREDDNNVGAEAFGGQVCFGRQHRHPHKLCRMATIEHCMHISNEWSHGDNRTWHAKTPRPQSSFVLRVQSSPWVSPWSLHHAGKTTPSVPWCDGEGCWPIVPDELGIVCCYLVSAAPLRRSAIVWVPPGGWGAIVIVGGLLGLGTPSRPRGVGQSSQLIVSVSCFGSKTQGVAGGGSDRKEDPTSTMPVTETWRVLILVVGFDQQHWFRCPGLPLPQQIVDVRVGLPIDPADEEHVPDEGKGKKKGKGKGKKRGPREGCVDSVANQPGFAAVVLQCFDLAKQHGRLIIGCRRGLHRSPVVAGTVRELLAACHYSVGVIELALCQIDLVPAIVNLAEDWQQGHIGRIDFIQSYSNFQMEALAKDDVAKANLRRCYEAIENPEPEAVVEEEEHTLAAPVMAPLTPYAEAESASFYPAEAESASGYRAEAESASDYPAEADPASYYEQPHGFTSAASSGSALPPPPPPLPPHESVLSVEDMGVVEEFALDHDAVMALVNLGRTSQNEKSKVLAKLHNKTRDGKAISNTSAFVQQSCKNAIEKVKKKLEKK